MKPPWLRRAPSAQTFGALADALDILEVAVIRCVEGRFDLVHGQPSLQACLDALGGGPATPQGLIEKAIALQPDIRAPVTALLEQGRALSLRVRGPGGAVTLEGGASGALAWLTAARRDLDRTEDQRLPALLDARDAPAWSLDASGALAWANQAWLRAVGARDLGEARAKRAVFHRDADALARHVLRTGETREIVRWVELDGERRAFRLRATRLAPQGAAVWADDITQAERVGERLDRLRRSHDATLSLVADAIGIFASDGRLVFHNPAFAALWGLDPAWLAGRPTMDDWLERLRRLRRLPETTDFARFKAGELARRHESEVSPEAVWRLPDERTLRVVSQPHPQGGVIMIFSDITPELRLKSQFNRLLQVQKATLDKLSDAVAVFGADGALRLHNEAFERLWSTTREALETAAFFDEIVQLCLPTVHDLQFWRDLKGRIGDPDPRARAPLAVEVRASDKRILAHQSRPLPDGATLVSFTDVTDARALERALRDREAALREGERLKREFVGGVSYELRTPLTTIMGYAELLAETGGRLEPRIAGYVGAIRSAAAELARSIETLLTLAELEAGEIVLQLAPLSIPAMLNAAVERWTSEAQARGLNLSLAPGAPGGVVVGDEARLATVLDHLIANAVRNTPSGGDVTLSAQRAEGEIRLQVADTGRGIPFHVQAHVFDRYGGGERDVAGVGLAVVKAMVELHGGWVSLESEPGAGAVFTCHLPETGEAADAS